MPGCTATYTLPPLTDGTNIRILLENKATDMGFLGRNDKLRNANELVSNGFRNLLLQTLYD